MDVCKLVTPGQATAAVGEKVGSFKQLLPGITDSCTATLASAAAAILNVTSDTCLHSVALAKIALPKI